MPDPLTKASSSSRPPHAPRPDGSTERRTLREYYVIIRERIWLALSLALLVSIGTGYYLAREKPMYMATATLQFERPERVVLNEQVLDASVRSDIDLNTYLQILNSGRLRTQVIESLTPDETRMLQRPFLETLNPGETPPPISALIGGVTIESPRNSLLVSVTARNRDPEGAALVANRYVEQFIEFLFARGSGVNEAAVEFLQRRAIELEKEYTAAEQTLQDYRQHHNLVSLDDSLNIVNERLRAINNALTSVRIERLDLEVYLRQIEEFRNSGRNLAEIGFIGSHGDLPALRAQLNDLLRQETVLSERYLERHPRMIELANAIATVRRQIENAVSLAVADLESRYGKIIENERSLATEYNEMEREAFRLGALSVEFKSLENQATVARNNYISILDRLNQTTTARNLENLPVRPLDRAVIPGTPYTPNINKIIRTSLALGLLIFFGVPIGLNLIDDRVKSSWDVESFIGAHLLGIIPELYNVPAEERHKLLDTGRNSPGVESFLSVYSTVKMQSRIDFPKSILVTSTVPGEGKTLLSSNLAGCFARHNRRVLLVDGDLRRPMLHRNYGLGNDLGILSWAEGKFPTINDPRTDEFLGITEVAPNLSLLRAGGRSKSPTEVLENAAFGRLIESLKKFYDLIIIDSPPMGAVADGLLISERVDEVLYVCRFNHALRKHIRIYTDRIKDSHADLLGIVLNGLSPRRIEYYSNYRYYRSYQKYYSSTA